jgi:hypothetical protein
MIPHNPSPAALVAAVAAVRGAIRRDRRNRYSLVRDWTIPPCSCTWWPDDLAHWETPLLVIERVRDSVVRVTVRAYTSTAADNICDGATLSPDSLPGILPAALFHDPWYCRRRVPVFDPAATYEVGDLVQREGRVYRQVAEGVWEPATAPKTYEDLAAGIGVSPRTVRKFGDALFYSIARAGGCPRLVAWLYYAGIRVGYPVVRPFLADALLAALLAGGCAGGCISQGDDGTFLDPSQFDPPTWERVQ